METKPGSNIQKALHKPGEIIPSERNICQIKFNFYYSL